MTSLNKKVLIVEDDEDLIFIFQKKFTDAGFNVVLGKDGLEGAAVAEKEHPDIIFSDMLMPKLDGIGMAKKIRETDKTVPIIFLTNMKDAENVEQLKQEGDFDYLIKSDTKIDDIILKAKEKLGIA